MSGYRMLPAHPFFDVMRTLAQREIRMGDTVCFVSEVDLTNIESTRDAAQRAGGRKPGYTAFVLHALSRALRECPYANRRIHQPWGWPLRALRIQQFEGADIAVAVERNVPGAEVATFIDILRDAETKNLAGIQAWLDQLAHSDTTNNRQWREFTALVERAPRWLAGLLAHLPARFPSYWNRYRGGAALLSSPTKYGVDLVVGAWTAPLGVSYGLAKDRAIVRDGRVVPCRTFQLILNFDRRIMAGAQAARFFKQIVELLEKPASPAQASQASTSPALATPCIA